MPKKLISLDELSKFKSDYDSHLKTLNGVAMYGGGNYTFDDEFDEESTNALQNQVISKEIKELNYELAIIREELFEVLLTELDYKVSYAMNYVIPDSLSDSDGTHRLVYSETMLKEIEGNGVALNQLVNKSVTSGTETVNDVVFTKNDDGSYTINGTASATTIKNIVTEQHYIDTIIGHKLLFIGLVNGLRYQLKDNADHTTWVDYNSPIITYSYSKLRMNYYIANGNTLTNFKTYPQIFDLTQMFGAGNEPTLLTDNRIQWLLSLGYVPYNTGSLKNTTISGIKLIGNNKFNGELEIGGINTNTGETSGDDTYFRSKDFIKVISGQTYTLATSNYSTGTVNSVRIHEWDASNNYLGRQYYNGTSHSFTLKSNTTKVKLDFANNGVALTVVPTLDITFHLSSADIGYKPYTTTTISLPQTTLLGALDSHDTLSVVEGNVVEGEQLYNIVHTSNDVAYTFTGSETLSARQMYDGTRYRFLIEDITNAKSTSTNNDVANAISDTGFNIESAYTNYTSYTNCIAIANNGSLYIYDDSNNTNTSTSKSAILQKLSGKTLQYQLATPNQTTVAQDLHFDQVSSIIEQGGTIEPIFEDVPPNITTTFVVKKAVGE